MTWLATLLFLVACEPAGPDPDPPVRDATTDGGTFVVAYAPTPDPIPVGSDFSLLVSVHTHDAPCPSCEVDVDATMPGHDHGMNVVPTVAANGDGTHLVTGMHFHMGGRWVIEVDVHDGGDIETAHFDVVLD